MSRVSWNFDDDPRGILGSGTDRVGVGDLMGQPCHDCVDGKRGLSLHSVWGLDDIDWRARRGHSGAERLFPVRCRAATGMCKSSKLYVRG